MRRRLYYSLAYTFRDIFKLDFKNVFKDKRRNGNCILALNDILMGSLVLYLLDLLFTGGTGNVKKDIPMDARLPYNILSKSVKEFNPLTSIFGLSWEPSFYKTMLNIQSKGLDVLTGDRSISNYMIGNISALKDIPELKQYLEDGNKSNGGSSGGGGATSNF